MQFLKTLTSCLLFLLVLSSSTHVASQSDETCPTLVDQAIDLTSKVCQQVGRNQACYGNLNLVAEPRPNAAAFRFEQPGDIVGVMDIASLKLSPMDTARQTWGVSLLKLQANIPDTLPGQNVTFVLFGDVELRPAVPVELPAMVRAGAAINVRAGPSRSEAVTGSLAGGTPVTANGCNEAGDWLRVKPPGGGTGWVFQNLVEVQGDVSTLDHVGKNDTTSGNLQAFYLRTGFGDSVCKKAPNSGIVIQTPQGVGEVALRMNGVDIQLGSTAYMEASPENGLQVFTLDGHAKVAAKGASQTVTTGNRTTVPLDENLTAKQAPSTPAAFTPQEVSGVAAPLRVLAQGNFNNYDMPNCTAVNGPLLVDQYINVVSGNGCWNTLQQAQAAFEGHAVSLSIDGVAVNPTMQAPGPSNCLNGAHFTGGMSYHWTPQPGTYTLHMIWSGPVANLDYACTVRVFG